MSSPTDSQDVVEFDTNSQDTTDKNVESDTNSPDFIILSPDPAINAQGAIKAQRDSINAHFTHASTINANIPTALKEGEWIPNMIMRHEKRDGRMLWKAQW